MIGDMAPLPCQWISWNHEYVLDDADDASGQFQYALKATTAGDRQLVLEGESARGIVAVVDFAGHNRKAGPIYYAWGATTWLPKPLDAAAIRADNVLRRAFANRQGRAKQLAPEAAMRIAELIDVFPEQRLPATAPSEDAELELWIGGRGRSPEFLLHDEVETTKRLWRQLGFTSAPRRGHRLQNGRYPDLYSKDGVVGEVKNIAGPNWGPAQLSGYMHQLDLEEPGKSPWRGVLVHGGETLSRATAKHWKSRLVTSRCGRSDPSVAFSPRNRVIQQFP
jgi:hypothetical protein